ncbi:MAG TPA: hypothetical protein VKB77_07605, partial [Terriglobales bacterium]|nr:hypothetical protein [Terriglobales bacterium]
MPDAGRKDLSPPAAGSQAVRAQVVFHDPAGAERALSQVAARVSPGLARALPSLLADLPDPDSALLMFDRLIHDSPVETVRLLELHHHLAHYALVIFGYSRFLGETLLQNPDLLHSLLRDKRLDQTLSPDEFREALARLRSRSLEADVSLLLARFKRREYVRIMLRDVLGIATLAETTSELSALADVVIEAALREAENILDARYSTAQHLDREGRLVPTPFCVLSLGKLGGNELNYSSDVDLFYIFGDGQEPTQAAISNREYFVRLAQQLTDMLSRPTREGAVFRIDMRLRPQGSQGELAVSLSHALGYYASHAHDWERQALIKVRHSAGNTHLARAFIHGVEPYVYAAGINLAAISTALEARQRISQRPRPFGAFSPHAHSLDVKLDRGGIRDIEFLVQCLQRVYGGSEPWLRSGGTLFSLQKLHDKRHIAGRDFQDLTNTYVFLRHVEHRLQLRQGQQIHRLPPLAHDMAILARSLAATAGQAPPDEFEDLVRRRMGAVAAIYHRILEQQGGASPAVKEAGYELQSPTAFTTPDPSNEEILRRLASDSHAWYQLAICPDLSTHSRRNLFRFLSSAWTGSERYADALRHPEAVPRARVLFESSDYLTELLIRHPEEMSTLASLPEMFPPEATGRLFPNPMTQERADRDPVFAYVASSAGSDSEKMALLRRHYRHRIFASGARDITELRGVYASLASTTAAAEDAMAAAFAIADSPPGLAVMALGRLGSGEFDLLSDADVLFVCEDNADRALLTRSAERVVQILAAYTRDGMVFPVDTRLRPHGREGELLVSPAQLLIYCAQEAQPWEALMYTKLRYLAGSSALAERAVSATTPLFQRSADDGAFRSAVCDMRAKLEATETAGNLKTSPGAVYDIDFVTSFFLVKNRVPDKQGSLRDRLWRCAAAGLLTNPDAALLDHAAELFRTVDHVLRLVVGRASKWLPANETASQLTESITSRILHREFASGL